MIGFYGKESWIFFRHYKSFFKGGRKGTKALAGGAWRNKKIMIIKLVFLNMKEFDFICVHINCQQSGRGDAHDNDVGWAVRNNRLNCVTSIT